MHQLLRAFALAAAAVALALTGCTPVPSALVTGDGADVMALDLDSDAVIGTVELPADGVPPAGPSNSVVILDGALGFVAGADHQTFVVNIDETTVTFSPDSPVRIPNRGRVLAAAERNPWVLVRGYDDTAGRFTLSANNPFDLTLVASSVSFADFFDQATVCDDGETVLVRQFSRQRIHLFSLDREGRLADTGHALSLPEFPGWVACAPGAAAGAVLVPGARGAGVVSFTIDPALGLTEVHTATGSAFVTGSPGPINNAVAFAADGTGLFLRTSSIIGSDQRGWIERFSFNPTTAEIGATAEFSVGAGVSYTFGREQIGVHPEGDRIYLPDAFIAGGRVRILDAISGAGVGSLTHPDMPNPVEIKVPH
jgi:hypothetical protein